MLGCGDIRSCFYTIWKNFDPFHRCHFNNVHFVLNDCSAAIVARDILLLLLVTTVPNKGDSMLFKKSIAALWSIWFCHELLPEHNKALKESLHNLIEWSESMEVWSTTSHNPLQKTVDFSCTQSLQKVRAFWQSWVNDEIGIKSVKHMKQLRGELLRKKSPKGVDEYDFINTFHVLSHQNPYKVVNDMREELKDYFKTGNAYAENVLDIPFSSGETFVNSTFFELKGIYSLHYGSLPYGCFSHVFLYSKSNAQQGKVGNKFIRRFLVSDNHFHRRPLLANSIQQLAMWVSSSADTMRSGTNASFTFDVSDALHFCQQLQFSSSQFDAIHSSNLSDHLSLPNLVLTTTPLLTPAGFLFANTLHLQKIHMSLQKFLEIFGFNSSYMPLFCGITCLDYEGEFTDSLAVRPTGMAGGICLLWQKVQLYSPLTTSQLQQKANLTSALVGAIKNILMSCLVPMWPSSYSMSTETAVMLLKTFSLHFPESESFSFWEHFCLQLKAELPAAHQVHFQTQALLHNLHLHLTVSEATCPLCTGTQFSSLHSVVVARKKVEEVINLQCPGDSPPFVVFIHKGLSLRNITLDILSSKKVNIVNSLVIEETESGINIQFYFPNYFVEEEGYSVSVFVGKHHKTLWHLFTTNLERSSNAEHKYVFTPTCRISETSDRCSDIGEVTKHIGDDKTFTTFIKLNDDKVASNPHFKSHSILEFCCEEPALTIGYPYPIEFKCEVLPGHSKQIKLKVERKILNLYERKPISLLNPSNQMLFPKFSLSKMEVETYADVMQYTKEDVDEIELNCKLLSIPPITRTKMIIRNLLLVVEPSECRAYEIELSPSDTLKACIYINQCSFDVENKIPFLNVSFCFLDDVSNSSKVLEYWKKFVWERSTKAIVACASFPLSLEQYEIFKRFIYFFHQQMMNTKTLSNMPTDPFKHCFLYPLVTHHDLPKSLFRARKEYCTTCKKETRVPLYCPACDRAAKYCSEDCQKKHWAVHKKECRRHCEISRRFLNPYLPLHFKPEYQAGPKQNSGESNDYN